jgi:ribosomal protein L20
MLTVVEKRRKETSEPLGNAYQRWCQRARDVLLSVYGALKKNNIELNRKVLADLAMNHPEAFKAVVDQVK